MMTYSERRRFAIGDIHGSARALMVLLQQLRVNAQDLVVVLGDIIDRGPDTRGVIETLLDLRETCELILIQGNHEEMFLTALEGYEVDEWLRHGGVAMLNSYGGDLQNIPAAHLEFLRSAVDYWEGPAEICVHANLEPGIELTEQSPIWLRWQKLTGLEYPHPSGKRVICGHSAVSTDLPLVRNGWVCLDTLIYRGGYITALNLDSGEIIQANQNGDFRCGISLRELES